MKVVNENNHKHRHRYDRHLPRKSHLNERAKCSVSQTGCSLYLLLPLTRSRKWGWKCTQGAPLRRHKASYRRQVEETEAEELLPRMMPVEMVKREKQGQCHEGLGFVHLCMGKGSFWGLGEPLVSKHWRREEEEKEEKEESVV